MRDTRWAWLGMLTGVVLGLVVFAPALWLAAVVLSASNGQLQALQPRGTVWNGSARFVLSGGASSRDARVLPGQLELETLEGSLKLSGRGQWNGARWNFRGQASASAENESVLGNLLNIVGRRQGTSSIIALD